MRTSLTLSLVLLALTIAVGCWSAREARALSDRYISAAEELRIMAVDGAWLRAEETIAGYIASWQETIPWLQILINHDDIDDVTLALVQLQAAIHARDQADCLANCAALKENAGHI